MEKLNPFYITGFTEGEGSFYVGILPRKMNTGWEVRPSFSLSQNEKDKVLVSSLVDFFGCGFVRPSKGDQTVKYEVRSLKDLQNKIIPHFKKYQLNGRKQNDFIAFEKAVEIMSKNKHLENEGLKEIIFLALSMTKNPRRIKSLQNILTLLKV